jgi:hypothetical protein
MKTFKGILYGIAIAIAVSAGAATVYNYFPPPGMTYSPTTGFVVGSATGGAQGAGTVNAQGVFVNGAAVVTGSGLPVGANPTGTVGLTTVNGSATTFLRSDAAPPLSQAIAPTWTAAHTFAFSGIAIDVNSTNPRVRFLVSGATANQGTTLFIPSNTGIEIDSATDAAPTAAVTTLLKGTRTGAAWSGLTFGNATDNTSFTFSGTGQLSIAGGTVVGSPTGGNQGAGTINMQGCFVNGVACSTGGAAGANPTGTVGLTTVNGVAGTYMRSDAAPPLSQAIAPTWTGAHTFNPSASGATAITITNPATAVTAFKAQNNGTNDVEVVASSNTAGDAYFRSVALGGTNWSAGVQRSTNKYAVCNAVGISGTCSLLDTSGNYTVPASINTANGNANINVTGSGQVVITTTSTTTGAFVQGDFCNTAHCLHTLNTTTGQSTPFITNGPSAESAYIYTDATVPLCLGSASSCRINLDNTGHVSIQTPTSTSTASLNVSAIAGQYGEIITAPSSTGQSVGFRVFAGTNASDFTAVFTNAAQTVNYFVIDGAGSVYSQGRTAEGAGTLNVNQLYQGDQPIYREVSWAGTCTSGGCTTGISKGTGTVTRNSAGNYSVAFSASFGGNAGCTASTWSTLNNGAISTNVASANTTSVTVVVLNSSGTAVDSGFTVVCIG